MNPEKQITELREAKRALIFRLEEERAHKHEEAAQISDQIMRLRMGERR